MEGMLLEKELGDFIESLQIGRVDKYSNMSVFPLFSERESDSGYLLLDEAVARGKFAVEEISEGGSVPELMARNLTPDMDVLLMQGEQLIGAKQNRIINASIIVGRGSTLKIPASCCERTYPLGPVRAMKLLRKSLAAKQECFKSVGKGSELRFEGGNMTGFALFHGEKMVHMAVFV